VAEWPNASVSKTDLPARVTGVRIPPLPLSLREIVITKHFFKNLIACCFVFICITISAHAAPWIISHRGGGQNFPENTLLAFSNSLDMGCQALELDVQVTRDGVVVVYHPEDLKKWTNGSGRIASCDWKDIANLDAAYNYKPEAGYPFRNQNLTIPKLEEVLTHFPKVLIIVDMKSLPAERLVEALIQTISDEDATRLVFYSTNAEHIDLLNRYKPHWKTFEKRDVTRQRLLDVNQTDHSNTPITSSWMGFELKRQMMVTETFALGVGVSGVEFHLWTPRTISYLRGINPNLFIVLFGINTKEEWEEALSLDVQGVYTDNPLELLKLTEN
jgi:glycerophosphoryl diester phosphodiesterase